MQASCRGWRLVASGVLVGFTLAFPSPSARAETLGPPVTRSIAPPTPEPAPTARPAATPPPAPREIEAVEGVRMGVAVPMGLNINTDPGRFRGTVNPQQLGFQGDLGYSWANRLYLGTTLRVFIGQKLGDDVLMTQQGVFVLGYTRPAREFIGVRPVMELGWQRYHFETSTGSTNDAGFLMAFGGDVVADVRDHFYLISMVRLGFAAMGDGDGDLTVAAGSLNVYGQAILGAGLRFD